MALFLGQLAPSFVQKWVESSADENPPNKARQCDPFFVALCFTTNGRLLAALEIQRHGYGSRNYSEGILYIAMQS